MCSCVDPLLSPPQTASSKPATPTKPAQTQQQQTQQQQQRKTAPTQAPTPSPSPQTKRKVAASSAPSYLRVREDRANKAFYSSPPLGPGPSAGTAGSTKPTTQAKTKTKVRESITFGLVSPVSQCWIIVVQSTVSSDTTSSPPRSQSCHLLIHSRVSVCLFPPSLLR